MDSNLATLLAQARTASPGDRIEHRDRIAAFSEQAISAVEPWVADRDLGAFAVRVILATDQHGAHDAAVRSLASLRGAAATERIRRDIDEALRALGARVQRSQPPEPRRPRVLRASPASTQRTASSSPVVYMRSWTYWHLVVGVVAVPGGRKRYLGSCHRWKDEGHVNRKDAGLRDVVPTGGRMCELCDRAGAPAATEGSHAKWLAATAAIPDGSVRVHLCRDRSWHVAADPSPLEAPKIGRVHLTECGWWIEDSRVRAEASSGDGPSPVDPVCDACLRVLGSGVDPDRRRAGVVLPASPLPASPLQPGLL
jgi:hypothetical protein